jgi:hypothetical protein
MLRRRRPLLRAAAVGGAAYYAGKRRAENEPGAESDEPVDEGAVDDGSLTDDDISQLEKLSKLKEQGVLTDDEFEAQKQKILGP